jgi:hypothetical protein
MVEEHQSCSFLFLLVHDYLNIGTRAGNAEVVETAD